MEIRVIHGKGRNLAYTLRARLHGNSGSKSVFRNYQLKHFKDFHTFALDSRGHGQSISVDENYSIEQYSCDVIRFCQALKIERASVIGYSDGGNISLWLALKAPEMFPKIVAISPNYLVSGSTDASLMLTKRICRLLTFLGRMGLPTRKQLLKFDLMLKDIGLSAEDLRKIRTSLRILYAEHDLIKEDHILNIHQNIPGSTLQKIYKCSHITIPYRQEAIADMQNYLAECQ